MTIRVEFFNRLLRLAAQFPQFYNDRRGLPWRQWDFTGLTDSHRAFLTELSPVVVTTFGLERIVMPTYGTVYVRTERKNWRIVWQERGTPWELGIASHLENGNWVECFHIKDSTINDERTNPPVRAGKGLFALRPLKRDQRIPYDAVFTPADYFTLFLQHPNAGVFHSNGSRAIYHEVDHVYADANWVVDSSIADFCNHNPERMSVEIGGLCEMEAIRSINAGEEIFTDYGEDYGLPSVGLMTFSERTAWRDAHPSHHGPLPIYRWTRCPAGCGCDMEREGLWTDVEFAAQKEVSDRGREVYRPHRLMFLALANWRALHPQYWPEDLRMSSPTWFDANHSELRRFRDQAAGREEDLQTVLFPPADWQLNDFPLAFLKLFCWPGGRRRRA